MDKDGEFSVEYMLDHLVSRPIHVQVKDIDANPSLGQGADGAYHVVTAAIFADLKAAYNDHADGSILGKRAVTAH